MRMLRRPAKTGWQAALPTLLTGMLASTLHNALDIMPHCPPENDAMAQTAEVSRAASGNGARIHSRIRATIFGNIVE